jgi:hypothetical protein
MSDPNQQDAEYLKLLTIFHYVVAGMMALWGSFPIIHLLVGIVVLFGGFGPAKPGEPSPALFGGLFVLVAGTFMAVGWSLAVCTFLAGRNLARRQHYLFCLIVAGVMATACTPFGTILGVFTIIVLMRPSVKEAFGVPSSMGATSDQPLKRA